MTKHLRKLQSRKERGASAVEYALLVAAIALVLVAGAFLLGQALDQRLEDTSTCVGDAPTCPDPDPG